MNAAELKILRKSFETLTAGKNLEGRAKQVAFNITQQLRLAEATIRRKGKMDAVPRKLLIEDVEELQRLLAREAE